MNIFYLHDDASIAAQMMCDKHIPKMIVEAAQMLSTAHRMLDGTETRKPSKSGKRMVKYYSYPDSYLENVIYKAVHFNHPSTVWTRESDKNYMWHYNHFIALGEEFEMRFGKLHKTILLLKDILSKIPKNIPKTNTITPIRLAMKAYPECIVENDGVQSYRNFYLADKREFAKWEKGRQAPTWWTESVRDTYSTGSSQQAAV